MHYAELSAVQWQDEIPAVLKTDMKSLIVDAGSTSSICNSGVVLNMQQRVIQSGLDSLRGVDSKNIIALFKGNLI